MASVTRTNEQFFKYFQQEVTALQSQINDLTTQSAAGGEGTDAVEHCSAGIARLSNEVRDQLDALPSHDRQTYSTAIKALSAKLQTARGQVIRKQKFSFKNSAFKIQKNESAISLHDIAQLEDQRAKIESTDRVTEQDPPTNATERAALTTASGDDRHSYMQRGRFIAVDEAKAPLSLLVDIDQCVADLRCPSMAYPTFRLRNVTHSIVFISEITGPFYLEGITNSVVVARCHQFRMHNSTNCEVYLHCSSKPIIEDCNGIHFAPWPEQYFNRVTGAENRWDQINDFKWLRAEQSPHWSLLPAEHRRGPEYWTKVAALKSSDDVSDSITALELP